jgi:hypothetical protein
MHEVFFFSTTLSQSADNISNNAHETTNIYIYIYIYISSYQPKTYLSLSNMNTFSQSTINKYILVYI